MGEAVQGASDLSDGVVKLIQRSSEVLVLSPSEVTRIEWLTGGSDQARRIADARLGVVLGQVNKAGVSASGMTGDEQVTVAFEDALRKFGADHILIALRRADRPAWRRRQMVDRLLEQFNLPVADSLVGS